MRSTTIRRALGGKEITEILVITSVLSVLLYYFEDYHPKRLEETKRILAEAESIISTDVWNSEKMQGNSLLETRDTLQKESLPEIPTWHRSALFIILMCITGVLAFYAAASVSRLALNLSMVLPLWLWNAFKLSAYLMLVCIAILAGNVHRRILRRLKVYRKEVDVFSDSVKAIGPFLK